MKVFILYPVGDGKALKIFKLTCKVIDLGR